MEKPTVHVDVDPQSPFVLQLQKSFPQFEIVAQQVTPNDHANARAFSHLASKLIEHEIPTSVTILDIGSAPARRMYSEHKYHCVCPMRSPEDPDRLMNYASRLADKAGEITNKRLHDKLADLKSVLESPDAETGTICFHNDVICRTTAEVSVMQNVYINAPSTIYHQALKGVRKLYWIGFDTTQFMFSSMAGSYPSYNTNWADERVLEARNIGLCSTKLREGTMGKLSTFRKKALKPGTNVYFSVGSTLYPENRADLQSWHLPSVFHLKGKQSFTCRCDTAVNCEGYVVKKITISPGITGRVNRYTVTNNSEGFLLCKITDTVKGERVSFPVCTYIPPSICDQMTGILATDIQPEDAQKLLVGLNQRIVVNGKTNRNTNTMQNYLLPAVATGLSKWAKERKADCSDEKPLNVRERKLAFGCLWAFKTKKIHSFYRPPGTQTIVKVAAEFSAFPMSSVWTTSLPMSLRQKVKLLLVKKTNKPVVTITDTAVKNAQEAYNEAVETAEAEEKAKALPPLKPTAPPVAEDVKCEVTDLVDDAGAALVETPRGKIKIIPQEGDVRIGSYTVISPAAVLRNQQLEPIHELAEQVKIITHGGRTGRYSVEPYDAKVLLPTGCPMSWQHFAALSESATLVYNEREFLNRKLHHIATKGAAKNTEEEQYKVCKAKDTDHEYVYDVDARKCVKREHAQGLVLVGELTNPPYHELAYEGLRTRPAAPYHIETLGVIGTPGSGKSAIIKSTVTLKDLVTSGKKENCKEIENDVQKMRGMTIATRTVDSVLLNGWKKAVDVLYVDEAFACHAGTLMALIAIVKPRRKVVLCGDPKQWPFFNLMQLKVNFNNPERDLCTSTHYKYISRRCTQPVTAIVSTLHYDGKMRTTNPCKRAIEIDVNGSTKPKKGDIVLTCFRGWVKQGQIDYPGPGGHDRAASQGLTRRGVYAVRQKVNENPLYAEKSEHVNVLLTRTEDRIVWKTLQGDPWIKYLTNVPKGNFTATLEEWQAEHEDIMKAINSTSTVSDPFASKVNTCWAKAIIPILRTAGIELTFEQWEDLFPQFRNDQPYSVMYALDVICTKMFGMDLSSGIFSRPEIPLTFHPADVGRVRAHWDNSPGGQKFGYNKAVIPTCKKYPVYLRAGKGDQILPIYGRVSVPSARNNLVPLNRNLPHSLTASLQKKEAAPLHKFLNQLPGHSMLLVSKETCYCVSKRITWVAPLGVRGADHNHDLHFGFPPLSRYDLVVVNMGQPYRFHHYQQCEEHAGLMRTLARSALNCLKPGGTLALKAYGFADSNSEDVVLSLARKFVRASAVRPSCTQFNTEMFFVFRQLDNDRERQFTQHHLNLAVSNIFDNYKDGSGAAPSYRVKRMNIADCTEEAVVNAANARGKPGDGVCRAIFKKWPKSFENATTEVETAVMKPCHNKVVIHAVGPDFRKYTLEEATKLLQNAYHDVAKIVNEKGISSVAIPLLSTGIYAAGADRLDLSLRCLFTALDRTDADVTIYCLDKKWEQRIADAIRMREQVTELKDPDIEIDEGLTRVHPDSCLKDHIGYSTQYGKLYSYFEGTKFHQTAKDIAEIRALFPDVQAANEQICLYTLGEPMESIREKCPVEDSPASAPPKTIPCLCMYAMTAERICRVRSNSVTNITVCSSFPLPKYRIKNVQKIQCTKVVLFNPDVPPYIPARVYINKDEPPVTPHTDSPPDTCSSRLSLTPTLSNAESDIVSLTFSEIDSELSSLNEPARHVMISSFKLRYTAIQALPQKLSWMREDRTPRQPPPVPPPRPKRAAKLSRLANQLNELRRHATISSVQAEVHYNSGFTPEAELNERGSILRKPPPVPPLRPKQTTNLSRLANQLSMPITFGDFAEGELDRLLTPSPTPTFGDFSQEEMDRFFGNRQYLTGVGG
uniref:Nonstructural protein P123 n=2 Tax=Aura virus TaxID=44158 RepID=UPI0000186939|nr:Nonstructural protein P123 [Aura virus]